MNDTAPVRYEIREIGAGNSATTDGSEAKALASLHAELLAHSPLVLMGPEFVEEFYYTVLPAEGIISGAIAYVNDEAAGFIVATGDANDFMSKALRKHWPRIALIMMKSVLRNPRRLLAIKEAYQIQRNVQAADYSSDVGELLSFGVLPEFRSRGFFKRTSIHVGVDLLRTGLNQLSAAGKKQVRAIVDKDNIAAQLFYRAQGWRVGMPDIQGWSVPTMEFLVDIDPET